MRGAQQLRPEVPLDFSKLRTGELLAGIGGLALIGVMFLDWFGIASLGGVQQQLPTGIPGGISTPETGIDAWQALDFIDFILLLTGATGISLAAVSAAGRKANIPLTKGVPAYVLGSVSVLLIIWRICDPVADGSLKIGIFLGLIAAGAVAIGGYMTATAEGFEPLVASGGRSTSSRTTRARSTSSRSSTTKRSSTTRKK
jgi:hypothetical protein